MYIPREIYHIYGASNFASGYKLASLAAFCRSRELSSFRFHYSVKDAWRLYFYTFASMLRRLSSENFNKLKTPVVIFSISYQRLLVIKQGLNIRLKNKTSCINVYTHYCFNLSLQANTNVSPRSLPFAG